MENAIPVVSQTSLDATLCVIQCDHTGSEGHRLTNGKGRCIQCHPATIGFVLRHARPGWIYIAVAHGKQLTKVGIGADVEERLRQLNAHRLAGISRWDLVYSDWSEKPATLEAELHRRLAKYRQEFSYDRKGGQIGREVFACSAAQAITALAEIYADEPD
ncbi:GIY-YIG nuclease family protein [Sphingobium baderi]|uniref:GIY-YIG nuclease family protein n=1 Tax=Sphingobium baderi TaxID=1332080 RepID=UPI0009E8103E|nr:GIY-YIG nuclease family protein [Sphingobium baderi]